MAVNPRKPGEEEAARLEEEKRAAEAAIEEAGAEAGAEATAAGATQAEVNKAVEKARKEEKDKLYPQLEALKDSIKEVQESLRQEREEKEALKREQADKEERARQAKLSDSEKQLEAIRNIEEQLRLEREERIRAEQKWEDAQKKNEVSRYREALLRDAGDEIIPDLVRGESVEEIDKTFAIAKARYEELAERFKATAGASTRGRMPRPTNPDTAALEEQELNEQLNAVDQDKYMQDPKYREKIKGELANAYAKAAGRA